MSRRSARVSTLLVIGAILLAFGAEPALAQPLRARSLSRPTGVGRHLVVVALRAERTPPPSPRDPVPPWEQEARVGPGAALWSTDAQRLADDARLAHPRVLIIGASIMARWYTIGRSSWDTFMRPLDAFDLGIPGDTTQNVLWRIGHGDLDNLHPRVVVALIGMDDLAHGWSPVDTAEGIQAVVRAIRAALPESSILLLGLPPRGESVASPWRRLVHDTDQLLAANHGVADYIDPGTNLLEGDGAIRPGTLESPEFLHPTALGYDALARAVTPAVRSLLG